ncbi:CLUMA_CG010603, isoform A [Clunio marinus]|uniref:CLUMA_CG010603, isoform A n=1 Tax=Clunio marinus TaxID=568069 RepID=A0A1J1IDY0_9DIPT|nr:CLUMA_CG010603, isoform A [Clunio marinus]
MLNNIEMSCCVWVGNLLEIYLLVLTRNISQEIFDFTTTSDCNRKRSFINIFPKLDAIAEPIRSINSNT